MQMVLIGLNINITFSQYLIEQVLWRLNSGEATSTSIDLKLNPFFNGFNPLQLLLQVLICFYQWLLNLINLSQ